MTPDTYQGWIRWIFKDRYRDKFYNCWKLMDSTVGPDLTNRPNSGVDVKTCWTAVT